MPLRATFVSSNPEKAREVRAILARWEIDVAFRRRRLWEPQADGLATVVRSKLGQLGDLRGPVMVEDSGIFLSGLDGFPGVYSAYAYRTVGLDGILRLLAGRSREARFLTVAGGRAFGEEWIVRGEVRGRIAPRPAGRGGFGYDPIFIPEGEDRTFAEMTAEEKARRSHRGRAFDRLGRRLAREERSGLDKRGRGPRPRGGVRETVRAGR